MKADRPASLRPPNEESSMNATVHVPARGAHGAPADEHPDESDATPRPPYVFRINPLSAGTVLSVLVVCLIGAGAISGLLPGAFSQNGTSWENGRDSGARDGSTAGRRTADPALTREKFSPNGMKSSCANCGTVESIRTVQVRSDDTPSPASSAARGGGNDIDRNMKQKFVYRLTIRMEDGSYRAVSQSNPPAFAVGDKVRVVDAVLFPPRS
jgi:hypothetical protein